MKGNQIQHILKTLQTSVSFMTITILHTRHLRFRRVLAINKFASSCLELAQGEWDGASTQLPTSHHLASSEQPKCLLS